MNLCVLVGSVAPDVMERLGVTWVSVTPSKVYTDHEVQLASTLQNDLNFSKEWSIVISHTDL